MLINCNNCKKGFDGKKSDILCPECVKSVHLANMLHAKSIARGEYIRRNVKYFESLFQTNEQKLIFKTLLEIA